MTTALQQLQAHSAEFRKQVMEVSPGVWTAIGYAASNVSMIIAEQGLIIIDTTESTAAAQNILAEFRKITDLPVKTILLTHGHRDHISGAEVFAQDVNPEIIARDNFTTDLRPEQNRPQPTTALLARTKRQFGIGLELGTELINLGLGPADRPLKGMGQGFLEPTRIMHGEHETVNLLGINLQLIAAPGESPDHMIIYWPDKKLLFCGDNYYKSFPNLYAIRGTRYRDFDTWADSLDLMIKLNPDILVTCHSRPLFGADLIRHTLSDYRDAIRYVIEKTVQGMDAGLTPDELAETVKLPQALAEKPYLQEYYGTVAWAVRAYFAGTVGWFDGNPSTLFPLPPVQEAEKIAELAGGVDRLAENMQAASDNGEYQWALQLADRLLRLEQHQAQARTIKISALRALADQQINATARNYYLSAAKELAAQNNIDDG